MKSTTSGRTVQELRLLFARWSLPRQLVSDNGPQFTCDVFEQFCASNGIPRIRTAPYHPSSNGLAERFVQTFKLTMKAMEMEKGNTNWKLTNILHGYRSTPQATTGQSPSQLMFGWKIRSKLDLLKPNVADRVFAKQQ